MPKKLTITEDKVIEAAEKHRNAKDVLKTLFPAAFANYNRISLQYTDLKIEDRGGIEVRHLETEKVLMRTSAMHHGYALTLNTDDFNWQIVDNDLIPTIKKSKTNSKP